MPISKVVGDPITSTTISSLSTPSIEPSFGDNGAISSLSSSNVKATSNVNFNAFSGGNEFNNGVVAHRSGWLNIWGNDMSVWA